MKLTTIALIIFISLLCSCQEQNILDYAEIPFNLENDRIVLEATVNGKKGRFVFDTGTTESYVDTATINLLPRAFTKTPYNGKKKIVLIYNMNKIFFGDIELNTKTWLIKKSDIIERRKHEGYDGLLGTRTFEGYWCELSFSKSMIILYREKPEHFTNFSQVKILNKYDADFYIPGVIDGKTFYFNIDTGMPPGIFFPEGLVKIKKPDEYREIVSDEEAGSYHLIKTNSIHILDETYSNVSVMTNSIITARYNNDESYNNFGMLGIDFLKYYDFLFDYRNLREGKSTGLYYEPNTPLEKRNYGFFSFMKDAPEFGVLNFDIDDSKIIIRSILKDSIAYELYGFRPGTVISKINGRQITEIPREELLDPSFYSVVDNYTMVEENIEHTISSPLKGASP
jgi:hypothetical protein